MKKVLLWCSGLFSLGIFMACMLAQAQTNLPPASPNAGPSEFKFYVFCFGLLVVLGIIGYFIIHHNSKTNVLGTNILAAVQTAVSSIDDHLSKMSGAGDKLGPLAIMAVRNSEATRAAADAVHSIAKAIAPPAPVPEPGGMGKAGPITIQAVGDPAVDTLAFNKAYFNQ